MRKLSYEYVRDKFAERGYRLLSTEYKGVSYKLDYECQKHKGLPNSISYNDFRKGAGCRYCGTEKRDAARRVPFETVKKAFEEMGYELLDKEYKNNRTPMRFKCPNHPDKETKMTYKSVRNGVRCVYCVGLARKTTDEVRKEFNKRGYNLISDYINSSTKLKFICREHPEYVSEITYDNFRSGQGCTYCRGTFRHSLESARKIFRDAGYELLEDEYINNTTPMRFKCPKHPDEDTRISLKSIQRGTRCRLCYIESIRGENHPNWNRELSDEDRMYSRRHPEYVEWRESVFTRDNFTCVSCFDNTGGNLVAHHLDGFNWCVERRLDTSNGVTLCDTCHEDFHDKYGYGDNTEEQYDEWINERQAVTWRKNSDD